MASFLDWLLSDTSGSAGGGFLSQLFGPSSMGAASTSTPKIPPSVFKAGSPQAAALDANPNGTVSANGVSYGPQYTAPGALVAKAGSPEANALDANPSGPVQVGGVTYGPQYAQPESRGLFDSLFGPSTMGGGVPQPSGVLGNSSAAYPFRPRTGLLGNSPLAEGIRGGLAGMNSANGYSGFGSQLAAGAAGATQAADSRHRSAIQDQLYNLEFSKAQREQDQADRSAKAYQNLFAPGTGAGTQSAGASSTAGATDNFTTAKNSLLLNPQEQFLYQTHLGNLGSAPVHNQDGSTSTLLQRVVEHQGKYYNVPSVWDGSIHNEQQAMQHAAEVGWDKWPSYATPDEADARYMKMHDFMERDVTGGQSGAAAQTDPLAGMPPQLKQLAQTYAAAGDYKSAMEVTQKWALEQGKPQDAPTTRTIHRGASEINQQWNSKTGAWEDVGVGPRFAPPSNTTINMPKTIEERDQQVLLSGDPSSPEYAMAYGRTFLKPQMINNSDGTLTPILPAVPPNVRKPVYMNVAQNAASQGGDGSPPPAGGNPATQGGPVASGSGVTIGAPLATGASPKGQTEDARKNQQLLQRTLQQLPQVIGDGKGASNYDELASARNQSALSAPFGAGRPFMSDKGGVAYDGLLDIAASYLYSVSGAAAGAGEVENLARTIMPNYSDGPERLAAKKARIKEMVDSIRTRAGTGAAPSAPPPGGGAPSDPLGIR